MLVKKIFFQAVGFVALFGFVAVSAQEKSNPIAHPINALYQKVEKFSENNTSTDVLFCPEANEEEGCYGRSIELPISSSSPLDADGFYRITQDDTGGNYRLTHALPQHGNELGSYGVTIGENGVVISGYYDMAGLDLNSANDLVKELIREAELRLNQ